MADKTTPSPALPKIAIVGPCSSGKSTLGKRLKALGFPVRQPAQEHSYVANMWQRLSKPDILIYLDVSYKHARLRRPHIDGGTNRLAEQNERLAHARAHCDFYIDTSGKTPDEVYTAVAQFLDQHGFMPKPDSTSSK
ncbi:MAG: hypothetical protein D6835_00415 [Candidatus Thermofonsia bacterium]|nr:MAG: hypothetical protein D6835_00415 [Candidatus Thermofonsia bacterium]